MDSGKFLDGDVSREQLSNNVMKMSGGVICWEEKMLKEESWWFRSFRDVQVVIETMGLFEDTQGDYMELGDDGGNTSIVFVISIRIFFFFKYISSAAWITTYLLHFFLSR